jgi:hypothetical protein
MPKVIEFSETGQAADTESALLANPSADSGKLPQHALFSFMASPLDYCKFNSEEEAKQIIMPLLRKSPLADKMSCEEMWAKMKKRDWIDDNSEGVAIRPTLNYLR